ncbi:hypothetical protein EYE40_06340 [Glaciihabitans arcticus]|uniref:Thioredoxin-like fold domain-containing protein n=1 Tax=Glaciihabitans arcticus TaxID=2668039 RepID=A0A4Q9GTV4_9MICO|nr:thioredoxin domain-containing protein [Glaciihabitans arcticus]TBN57048.1 hypothetical protein EYE40_06340 [Glaciihabitans arcticus]
MTPAPTTKRERRDEAREHARELREAAARRKRRNRWLIQGSVLLAAIAAAVIIVIVLMNVVKPAAASPLNMSSDGIQFLGDGDKIVPVETPALEVDESPTPTPQDPASGVSIVVYLDYQCPFCKDFETANGENIATWVAGGIASLEIHPVSFLDGTSQGNRYSSRAANAAACVANYEPTLYLGVNAALFVNQPTEGTTGMTDDQLLEVLASEGAESGDIQNCVRNESFKNWVTQATERARGPLPNSDLAEVENTPTVLVNGQLYVGSPTDATEFLTFVGSIDDAAATTE